MKKKIAIIGVGLIGGSLGMALKKSRKYHVIGIGRHKKKLALAKKLKAVDEISIDFNKGVSDADVVVVCTPVDLVVKTISKIKPHLKEGATVCDVGSVKGSILDAVKGIFKDRTVKARKISFVGTHPMAGSEKTGVRFASKDLYKGASVVLTKDNSTDPKALNEIMKMWQLTGARIMVMDARKHDRAVALISHLPHVLAFTMCSEIGSMKDAKQISSILAGSFKDITRVADSDPRDWAAICSMNRKEVALAIDLFAKGLMDVRNKLGNVNMLKKNFSRAKIARQKLINTHEMDR